MPDLFSRQMLQNGPGMRQRRGRASSLRSKFLVWFARNAARLWKSTPGVSACTIFAIGRFSTSRFAQAGRGRPHIGGPIYGAGIFGGRVPGNVPRHTGRPVPTGGYAQASHMRPYRTAHEGTHARALCLGLHAGVAASVRAHTWGRFMAHGLFMSEWSSCTGSTSTSTSPEGSSRIRSSAPGGKWWAPRNDARWVSDVPVKLRPTIALAAKPCHLRVGEGGPSLSKSGPCLQYSDCTLTGGPSAIPNLDRVSKARGRSRRGWAKRNLALGMSRVDETL